MAQRIKSSYSTILLIHVSMTVYYLCAGGFLMIIFLKQQKVENFIPYLVFVVITSFILFSYCHAGQCLIDEANQVSAALCRNKWYELDSKKMKYHLMLLANTQIPLQISGTTLFIFSHNSFLSVMKSSLAYLNFLLEVI